MTDTEVGEYDIAMKNGKIEQVKPWGNSNRMLKDISMLREPGGVGAHVHLEEPPLFGKGSTADNFETGTRSAIAGGTTTIIAFAPQQKSEDTLLDTLSATHAKADKQCYSDYSFYLLVFNPSLKALEEFKALREQAISSLEIYMTYAALQLQDDQILDVLLEARRQRITTMIHAENGQVIDWMTKKLEEKRILSEFIDTPILIVHVSTPAAAKHIREAQKRGLPVYAETCPQYLFLTKKDLDRPGFEGAKCVCSPPPREGEEDHKGIWEGLKDGTFTILSSDHCPFIYDDAVNGKKTVLSNEFPVGHFKYIPDGCPGVETRLALALSAERLSLQKFVEVTSANAAKLYGLYPRKDALIPGQSDVDLVVWYPPGAVGELQLKNEMLQHNVDYTPYEGRKVGQWPRYTILREEAVWDRDGGGLVGKKGYGQFLKKDASSLAGSRSEEDWDIRE
ncbi:hypothetical protein H2199_005205 [Coniosporium tulheliwenetii]|uniref:Uncharacterized protein n=1 Tax=Coniosporium tulheliwenetii TaxID=3383036 RepID=A0ACC2Z2N3_9PEZI|nr:hypothetical protein H2199_005205 [Cladosporium sp. JES 115]